MEITKPKARSLFWIKGAISGECVWLIAFLFWYAAQHQWFPKSVIRSEAFQILATICAVMSLPIVVGGWLFLWGDNGPPFPWIDNVAVNIFFGMALYAVLGALAGYIIGRIGPWRFSVKTMLIVITATGLLLGLIVALAR